MTTETVLQDVEELTKNELLGKHWAALAKVIEEGPRLSSELPENGTLDLLFQMGWIVNVVVGRILRIGATDTGLWAYLEFYCASSINQATENRYWGVNVRTRPQQAEVWRAKHSDRTPQLLLVVPTVKENA